MVRDDDIDYTVLGLKALETYGRGFSPLHIGRLWLENLPYNSIFTAEVIAYRNLINELEPPQTAFFRNPYREFIGAQIRGDMWGYVNPGNPHKQPRWLSATHVFRTPRMVFTARCGRRPYRCGFRGGRPAGDYPGRPG
jgi:hypothetical protein